MARSITSVTMLIIKTIRVSFSRFFVSFLSSSWQGSVMPSWTNWMGSSGRGQPVARRRTLQ